MTVIPPSIQPVWQQRLMLQWDLRPPDVDGSSDIDPEEVGVSGKGWLDNRSKVEKVKYLKEKLGGKAKLHWSQTNESVDDFHVTVIHKVKGWWINSMTIEIEFNEDGQDETIELTGSTVSCRYQEKCKFDFYPGIRWGIRKNYKSWWVVKIMGERI